MANEQGAKWHRWEAAQVRAVFLRGFPVSLSVAGEPETAAKQGAPWKKEKQKAYAARNSTGRGGGRCGGGGGGGKKGDRGTQRNGWNGQGGQGKGYDNWQGREWNQGDCSTHRAGIGVAWTSCLCFLPMFPKPQITIFINKITLSYFLRFYFVN